MTDDEKICPKCSGKMKAGVIFDRAPAHSGDHFWVDHEDKNLIDDILRSGDMAKITSYCCIKCGFLENYARYTKKRGEVQKKDALEKKKRFFDVNI